MLVGLIVVCRIGYAAYFPLDMNVYKDFRYVRSEAACHKLAEQYHFGNALALPFDLDDPVGRRSFENYCGRNGRECAAAD